ncbi:hypothetical protein F5Y16DRAFT_369280 [Xylariaceae sp. FL0255]|nr:hypothetical protein F5Y16DRAFT_369280 [Xylariaceae sp. FL0255]
MSMSKSMTEGKRSSICTSSSLAGIHTVKVLVGAARSEFLIPRRVLVTCKYFRSLFDSSRLEFIDGRAHLVVELEGQCPDMFRLFEYWLVERRSFDRLIDDAEVDHSCEQLHWDLVNLHLFGANIGETALQDVAMDGLQDMYLRQNWEISTKLVRYVYTERDTQESYRLRRWIVAMIAWAMGGTEADGVVDTFQELFSECPSLWDDYNSHLSKVAASKLEVDLKSPALRLPSNNLRNGERQFGYRQCSFHSHRSSVGQGVCPHTQAQSPLLYSPLTEGSGDSDSDS